MTKYLDTLQVNVGENGLNRTLSHEFRFVTSTGYIVYVPAGFVTDFASVPRLLWRIAPPSTGRHVWGAVIHDYLYRTRIEPFTRAEADQIFLEAMELSGVGFILRRSIYSAVRLFGGSSYVKRIV